MPTTILNPADLLLQGTIPRVLKATLGDNIVVPAIKAVKLIADSTIFRVSSTGTPNVNSITITASVVHIDTALPITFSISSGTATLTGTGNVRTLNYTDMTSTSIIITASVTEDGTTYTTNLSIVKVQDGIDGTDGSTGAEGTASLTYELSDPLVTLQGNSSGIVSNYSNSGTLIKVTEGTTPLTYQSNLGSLSTGQFYVDPPIVTPASALTVGAYSAYTVPESIAVSGSPSNPVKQKFIYTQDTVPSDAVFSTDGFYAYTIGQTSDTVYSYQLTSAWDISTATYLASKSVAAQTTAAVSLTFNSDGTTLIVCSNGTNRAFISYSLTTAWDITTLVFSGNTTQKKFSLATQTSTGGPMRFNSDGTKIFVAASGNTRIYQYLLTSPYQITTATFISSFDYGSTLLTDCRALEFNPTGTQMYLMSGESSTNTTSRNTIYQYSLSTAWDVSTAQFSGTNLDTLSHATQVTDARGLTFSPDLTKVYMVQGSGTNVYQYTLSTPGVLSSGTFTASLSVTAQIAQAIHVCISTDGTKLYVLSFQTTNPNVYQYNLSTPFDITTATYSGLSLNYVPPGGVGGFGGAETLYISPDGIHLIVGRSNFGNVLAHFTLATPWSLASYTWQHNGTIPQSVNATLGITFSSDGLNFYVSDYNTPARVWRNSLTTAWDLTTIQSTTDNAYLAYAGTCRGIYLHSNNKTLFALSDNANRIVKYEMQTANVVSSIVYKGTNSVYVALNNDNINFPRGIQFDSTGSYLYILCTTASASATNILLRLTLSTPYDINTIVAPYGTAYPYLTLTTNETNNAFNISSDGTKLILNISSTGLIKQVTTSVPWNFSSGTISTPVSYSVPTAFYNNSVMHGSLYHPNGTFYYMHAAGANTIYQFDVLTPFDISTFSYSNTNTFFITDTSTPRCVRFTNSNNNVLLLNETGSVYQYNLVNTNQITTAKIDPAVFTSPYTTAGLGVSSSGTKLLIADNARNLRQYNLPTLGKISGGTSLEGTFNSFNGSTITTTASIGGLNYSVDGTKVTVLDIAKCNFYTYNLSTAYNITTLTNSNFNLTDAGIWTGTSGISTAEKPSLTNGYSLSFVPGGSSNYFRPNTKSALNLGTGSWTLECWIKVPTGTATQTYPTIFALPGGVATGLLARYNSDFYTFEINSVAVLQYASSIDGLWHHLAVTRDGTVIKLFVDGIERASNTILASKTFDFGSTSSPTVGAGASPASNNFFTGYIYNLRISNTVKYTSSFITNPNYGQTVDTVLFFGNNSSSEAIANASYLPTLPGTTFTYSIGAGGVGSTTIGTGANGENTTVTLGTNVLTAGGGNGGTISPNEATAATGGSALGGFLNITGGRGGRCNTSFGGGVGAGGGSITWPGPDSASYADGSPGAQSVNVDELFEALNILGIPITGPGAGSLNNGLVDAAGSATGFGCGGGGTAFGDILGGNGYYGGGGGGGKGTGTGKGGNGGNGAIVLKLITLNNTNYQILSTGNSFTVPLDVIALKMWVVGAGGAGGTGLNNSYHRANGGGAGGVVIAAWSTVGTGSLPTYIQGVSVEDHNNFDAETTQAVISYPITVKRLNGSTVQNTLKQTILKSLLSVEGTPGQRGSTTASISGQTSWSDTIANQYFTTNYSGVKVLNDRFTQYGTNFAETRYWNGTSWEVLSELLDASLILPGTITGNKLSINSTIITDPAQIGTAKVSTSSVATNNITASDFLSATPNVSVYRNNSATYYYTPTVTPAFYFPVVPQRIIVTLYSTCTAAATPGTGVTITLQWSSNNTTYTNFASVTNAILNGRTGAVSLTGAFIPTVGNVYVRAYFTNTDANGDYYVLNSWNMTLLASLR